jgi:LPS-assembly protein
MPKKPALALVYAMLTAITGQALAAEQNGNSADAVQPGATVIEAHQLEVLLDRKLRAIGNAEIQQDGKTLSGDRIDYDLVDDEMHVTGNARLEQGGNIISGPDLRIRLKERLGEMQEPVFIMRKPSAGLVKDSDRESGAFEYQPIRAAENSHWPKGSSRGDAKLVEFEGPGRDRLHDARYTSCEVGVDDWYLRASELELNHNSSTGTAKHASVEFKGVPILYMPWIDFPFEKQRKSGFLAPNFGTTTRSGVELSVPYYWNIAPDMDATITPRALSKRGLQVQGEYRYLDEDYSGQDSIEFLPNDQQADRDRWFARLQHQHNFGNGWSGKVNLERVSDNEYFSDLSTNIATTSRVNLPQEAFLNYNDDIWQFTAMTQKFQTLDEVSYPYERLPQLTLTGHKEWNYAIGSVYTQWVSFKRASDAPATSNVTPNSNLSTAVSGNRFTALPYISLPMVRSYGYITPKLGLHYTRYDLEDPAYLLNGITKDEFQSDSRTLPIFSVDSGLYYDRDFRVVSNMYTQTLEPRLFYVYIPYRDQSQLPIFDTSLADLNMSTLFSENQFTGNDRVNDANQLTMAVTSRLIDQKSGIQRLAATVGQRFYFSDRKVTLLPDGEERTSNSSDIVTALTARLLTHWNLDAAWLYNTDDDTTSKANLGARYNPEPGKVLNLSYRYTRKGESAYDIDDLEQVDISTEWPLGRNWYGLARWNYSLADNSPIEGLLGAEYDAGCWQARTVFQRVSTATADENYAFFFQLELDGIASIGTSPLSLLRRSIPGYQSSSLIPDDLSR